MNRVQRYVEACKPPPEPPRLEYWETGYSAPRAWFKKDGALALEATLVYEQSAFLRWLNDCLQDEDTSGLATHGPNHLACDSCVKIGVARERERVLELLRDVESPS